MAKQIVMPSPQTDPILCAWTSQQLNVQFEPTMCRAIAHVDGGEIAAVCVLTNWTPHSCEISIATDGTRTWASRRYLHEVYKYAFIDAGKSRVNFSVAPDNVESIRLQEALGHKRECVLEDAAGTGHPLILYGLTKTEWLRGKYASPNK